MPVPPQPKIYHITSVANLAGIIADEWLISDAAMIERGGPKVAVGMSNIKQARLTRPVDCHAGLMVGGCVPFYFCPRSVMLYLLHMGNHPDLNYKGGQEPIMHLECDVRETAAWANSNRRRWAFTLSNARAAYTEFRDDLAHLDEIDWNAVAARVWSAPDVKEHKQAEFLVDTAFPWTLVSRIGVLNRKIYGQVADILAGAKHQPKIEIKLDWYY